MWQGYNLQRDNKPFEFECSSKETAENLILFILF